MKYISALLLPIALTLFTSTAMASATTPDHFYVRFDMGVAELKDQTLKTTFESFQLESDMTIKQALLGQLGIGYIFTPYWRMDLTGTQTGNMDISTSCTASSTCIEGTKGSGDVTSGQLLLNAYLDFGRLFGMGNPWFNPYIGGGIGAAHSKVGKISSELDGVEVLTINSHSSNSFAWRLVAGIGLAMSRHVMFDLSYGYMDAGTVDAGSEATLANGVSLDVEEPGSVALRMQQLMLGLRFRF